MKASEQKATTSRAKRSKLQAVLYDLKGVEVKKLDLPEEIFGQKDNKALISQYVYVYLQNQRQSTASAKDRSEVRSSSKKIYRQKGTGRARHGAPTANLFVGGGVTFGPTPERNFSRKMNKKQKRQALFISLSNRAKEANIIGLEDNVLKIKPKTKSVADLLSTLKLSGKKILIVLPKVEKNGFLLSARNISDINISQASTLNPYQVLNHEVIVFVESAFESLQNHFLNNENK